MATDFNNTIRTPHAAVLVWNYTSRLDADDIEASDVDEVDPVIISTVSLMGISTSKSKGTPAGTFNLTLAPTKNWVEVLTPGSWLCIMMGIRPIQQADLKSAAPDLVKMLGRIDSVRVNVGVDPNSGARMTTYMVQGQDWGQIFDTTIYLDPVVIRDGDSAVGTAERLLYQNMVTDYKTKSGLPSTTSNVQALIKFIAAPFQGADESGAIAGVIVKPENLYKFPLDLINFFDFLELQGGNSVAIGDAIHIESGVLVGSDSYNDTKESVGLVQPTSILGQHSLWQLLQDNCCQHINELVTDLSFDKIEDDPDVAVLPNLMLFKRVKPFIVRDDTPDLVPIKDLVSRFTDLKYVQIPLENVVAINAGNNWRDKYNFVEVQIDTKLLNGYGPSAAVKNSSQSLDQYAFGREGFRPMIAQFDQLPTTTAGQFDLAEFTKWKGLLRAWYFETHLMLNGAITFMGLGDHIRVGDNILVNAKVLGPTYNLNKAESAQQTTDGAYMLAHVENISHTFMVEPNGTRSFSTTISFVRGIITNNEGKQFNEPGGDGTLDTVNSLENGQQDNSVNVLSTSTEMDPNPDKATGT